MLPSMNTVNGAFFGVQNLGNSILAILCTSFADQPIRNNHNKKNKQKKAQQIICNIHKPV